MEEKKYLFLEALERLVGTMSDVLYEWEQLTPDDLAKTDGGLYPFSKSFDEVLHDVLKWEEDLHEKLSKD